MVNEVKKIKIENMVREINKAHSTTGGWGSKSLYPTGMLRLIFDYDDLNEFGKIIVNNAEFAMPGSSDYKIGSTTRLGGHSEKYSERQWIAKEWVTYCRGKVNTSDHMQEAFYFILWSLMVVSVDGSNKEEKLSIICDFAKMLMLTDGEIKDILEIVKLIWGKNNSEILFKKIEGISCFSIEYEEQKKCQYEEIGKYITSIRTLRYFSSLLETYVGIKGEDIISYREYGNV